MAQVDTAVDSGPAESSGESNYLQALQADADASFAALEEPTQPSAEVTTEEPAAVSTESVDSVAEDAAPDPVDAERLSRRQRWEAQNKEFADEIRAEERTRTEEAINKANQAEADKKRLEDAQIQQQARFDELANTWGNAGALARQLTEAIAEEDWNVIDEVAGKFGIENPSGADARGLLKQLKEQHQRNGEMGDFWRQAFMANTGAVWGKVAEREGVDREIVMGSDMGKALDHIYDAGAKSQQGRIDALEAENKALRAARGALNPSPESGGQGASSGNVPRTVEELERMGLGEFEKQFDKILASIPNR